MGSIALFGTIHGFHYTIQLVFSFFLQYFQQKVFSLRTFHFHFPIFFHKPNNLDLRQIKQNFLRSSHLQHHHHHHCRTNHHEWLW